MVRITAGSLKGRAVRAPATGKTRPSQSKLRQALFNSIQARVPDARVADLFAGSGLLGFEALSRGAAAAVFVEVDARTCRLIEANARELGVDAAARVLGSAVERAWHALLRHGPYDLVLADPPYAKGWAGRILAEGPWGQLLTPGGILAIEWSGEDELPETAGILVKTREKKYGDSILSFYEKQEPGPAPTHDTATPPQESETD